MNQEQEQQIQSILSELLDKMGLNATIEAREQDGVSVFNIQSEDSAMLIGQHGVNLNALQYLSRVLAQNKLDEPLKFVIDVGDYKKSREEFLRQLAKKAVERVGETGEQLLLKPMSAYERRVIHEVVSELGGMTSESVGEEPERRVLIKPQ